MWFKILLPNQHHPLAAMVGKDGKIYFRLVDVGTLLGRSNAYKFTKRFYTFVIQSKDVLPVHMPYPVMTQKSKLVTPDVVFNILNAELSSLATSFATSLNAGVALVEGNLLVESYKLSPVLHVQDSPVPRSVLVRKWVQDLIEKVMRRTSLVAPVECPVEPCMDFLVNEVEVSSRIPTSPVNNCLSINNSSENKSHFFVRMVSVQHLLDQCRHRTPIVFGNLRRWPDRVTYYEPEYPYTIFFNPTLECTFLLPLEKPSLCLRVIWI
ncbi:uncharacterized protein TNCV_874361 [Trichonephila clavipes]|nr:uncharacterized protein TNCV_874361 [Trichonephila clavipes]